MRYIRVEDGVYQFEDFTKTRGMVCLNHYGYQTKGGVCIAGTLKDWKEYKKADIIEELCDCFIKIRREKNHNDYILKFDYRNLPELKESVRKYKDSPVYGAIHIENKGLIYVAKMNEKGELELI